MRDDEPDISTMTIEFWPSADELRASFQASAYLGPLTEYYASIDEVVETTSRERLPLRPFVTDSIERGDDRVARSEAPAIAEFLLTLVSSGGALALVYKLLMTWAELVKGRRLKVVFDGIEIDATQLSEKQFIQLVERITQLREQSVTARSNAKSLADLDAIRQELLLAVADYEARLHDELFHESLAIRHLARRRRRHERDGE
jgi:hypothetical protein